MTHLNDYFIANLFYFLKISEILIWCFVLPISVDQHQSHKCYRYYQSVLIITFKLCFLFYLYSVCQRKAGHCAPLWLTYACHLSDSEDPSQHKHLDGDGEDEDKGESQRRRRRHNGPQHRQTHQLDAGEEMHAQRADLKDREVAHISDKDNSFCRERSKNSQM